MKIQVDIRIRRTSQKIAAVVAGILIINGLWIACDKADTDIRPIIDVDIFPKSGNTTQTFTFDLSKSESQSNRSSKIFVRWDWESDGIWDTPFTRMLKYEHRYYAPGNWRPRIEVTNVDGGSDTLSVIVPVTRGFSPPKIVLNVTPPNGHIYSRFLFDASQTRDDEDSLDLLEFRYDFEGDGLWDTDFGDSLRITHVYPRTGVYTPVVHVRDASGLIASKKAQIVVTMKDPRLLAVFRCHPDSVLDHTPIIMDASGSIDPDYPSDPLQFRWDWNNDRVWDTDWLNEDTTSHVFNEEFFHFVRLEVRSPRLLVHDTVQRIRVYHRNLPPRASFVVSTLSGNVSTRFRFDCWGTRDPESSVSDLFYRWDFDGNGSWDTEPEHSVVTFHQYDQPGVYHSRLEIVDPHGDTDTCSRFIHISRGTNQTGILEDTRGLIYETYGTVKIGKQWWYTRNSAYTREKEPVTCTPGSYADFGYLYAGPAGLACPPGWRVPSKEDWEVLFSNYPEDQLYDALMTGGEADFSARLGGKGHGSGGPGTVFTGFNREGNYWSTTKPAGTGSESYWIVTFDATQRKVLRGYYSDRQAWYSIRCVKDE